MDRKVICHLGEAEEITCTATAFFKEYSGSQRTLPECKTPVQTHPGSAHCVFHLSIRNLSQTHSALSRLQGAGAKSHQLTRGLATPVEKSKTQCPSYILGKGRGQNRGVLAAQRLGAHWLLPVSPRKPLNLPAWCFYEGHLFTYQQVQGIPKMSWRHQHPWHQAKNHPVSSDSCCPSFPLPFCPGVAPQKSVAWTISPAI